MNNPRIHLVVLVGILAAVMTAGAQSSGPGGSVPRGFSSQMLIAQLSLYVPEEATRGMYAGFGGRPNASSTQGAQAGQAPGGGAADSGRGFPQIQFTRDPKLFLTKEQITNLLPILFALRDSPLPTPGKAKQVEAEVDAQLTAAQKAEWMEFQKKLQARIQEFQQRMGANGTGGQSMGGQAQDSGQARDGGQNGGPSGGGGAPQMTLLQRRQRQLDAFLKVLQDRVKAGA